MASELQRGKLIIKCDDLENNPHCNHGPALLFERIQVNGITSKFFSCSAYKSRKECSFFVPYECKVSNTNSILKRNDGKKLFPKVSRYKKAHHQRFLKIKKLSAEERSYCHTCSSLLLPEECSSHQTHVVTECIPDFYLNHPSQLLHLQTNPKGESQFIFTSKSVDVIIDGLKRLNISKVLCVGTPSIHERIMESEKEMTSIFLDIDSRYSQFYDKTKFSLFNMMNFYFFENTEMFERVKQFLSDRDVVLIMDPPFSAREEPLSYTLSKFQSLFESFNVGAILPVIWIFPYFKEKEVLRSLPGMVMLDYDVTYLNQKQFDGSKKTSVVRIFTNLDASKFCFPAEEGYHYCSYCKRWVSKFNNHCFKCGICPSKNGHPYSHCNFCSRCVKDYWCHCKKCGRCALKKHPCDLWQENLKEKGTKKRKMVRQIQGSISKKSRTENVKKQKKKKRNRLLTIN